MQKKDAITSLDKVFSLYKEVIINANNKKSNEEISETNKEIEIYYNNLNDQLPKISVEINVNSKILQEWTNILNVEQTKITKIKDISAIKNTKQLAEKNILILYNLYIQDFTNSIYAALVVKIIEAKNDLIAFYNKKDAILKDLNKNIEIDQKIQINWVNVLLIEKSKIDKAKTLKEVSTIKDNGIQVTDLNFESYKSLIKMKSTIRVINI